MNEMETSMTRDMNNILMRFFTVLMLIFFSMGLQAKINVEIGKFEGGTIVEKGQTDPDEKGLVTVTITVTPDKGYTISQKDIVVVSTFSPSGASATRAPEIAANLTPIEKDPEDLSQPRDYSYIVSSTFGIWVKEANFAYSRKGGDPSTATSITSLSGITDEDGDYLITQDITGGTPDVSTFNGTLEAAINPNTHMPYKISGLSAPLFTTLTGTVKNLVLEGVSISGHTGDTGAIACTANGAARVYNVGILSGSVGGTGNTGGLVGLLEGTARVINCYSFAEITGGTNVGGIVGNNNVTTTADGINTMVMNCMFYGDITAGDTKSPVYGGTNIANLKGGLNTFNYYAYEQLPTSHITNNKYNSALAVEEKYLNRFEFYRLLLNSNKKLAAFYVTGDVADANLMLKWVQETADKSIANPKPYPILKAQGKYPSIINYDVTNAPDSATVGRNHGGKLGKTLSVTISDTKTDGGQSWPTDARITTGSLILQRTDKDFDRFNYNYDKVQLPYYNDVGEGNYTGNRVVTGWKIVKINDKTIVDGDPYTASNYPTTGIKDYPDHNYADRKSSNKDLYTVSKRVFSQGAYFDVPYGVTSITIEPYWGKAVYIADANYDVVYNNSYGDKQNVKQTGTQLVRDGATPTTFNGQKAETSIQNALDYIKSSLGGEGSTVYDNALVLMGNYHLNTVPLNGTRPFTMMSVDMDNDHEPDYSLIYHHTGRSSITPIRFDFLNIPGTAQAQKPNGASLICNFTIFKTRGWFEVTNTAFMHSDQVEYENLDNNTKTEAPLILLGGIFDQFVSTQSKAVTGKTIYIHLGSNVWIKEFGMGTHSDGSQSTPHVPVSVTGGEFPGFYLTGTYKADAAVRSDNAECYISGGYFHEAAGASLEQINGNVRWQIYNADIDNFYGGGINDAKPITGDITVDIYNSHVTTYCGGPKFGNMQEGKKVTTNAEGCVFGKFFGAGFGGTSLAKKKYYDLDTYNWNTLQGYYTTDRGKYFNGTSTAASQQSGKDYGKKGPGVATDFDYEFFVWSSGKTGARFFVNFASFSLAQCNDVTSNLKKCTIENNFYGGGSLGKVIGTATSVLDECTVNGNVFGGGYSATLPKINVRDAGFTTNPNFNSASGMFEPGVFSGTTEFEWKHVDNLLNNNTPGITTATVDGKTINYVLTNIDLTTLGQVQNVDLTIKGNTYVQGIIYKYGDDGTTIVSSEQTGGVFGGGDESAVNGNTKVDIQGTATSGTNLGINNVYGGGNTADVDGDATVSVTGGKMIDVYGGGRGETTTVRGDVTVHIGKSFKDDGTVDKTGSPSIEGSVYGGSALGKVNETEDKETKVNIYGGTIDGKVYGGTINESVYGGGKGEKTSNSDIAAMTFGNVTVSMEGGTVNTAVYGGSNANGVLKKDATVTITGGTVGTTASPINNVVFGGGKGEPTLVNGDVTVNIGTKSGEVYTGTAVINGHVYGGSALGNTNASKPASELVFDDTKKTNVNLYAGTIYGNVFGGGLGQKTGVNDATSDILSYVGGDVNVVLDGAKLNVAYTGTKTESSDNRVFTTGQIFGCNNLNGTPKGHVVVDVKRTVDSEKNTETARDSRTTYDVAAVYGGGNQADYVPTDATLPLDTQAEGYNASNPAKVAAACAEVIIEGCDKTSIEYVYGGGNAAAVPATDVKIKGSYIINQVFGGGNGKSTDTFTNPGADVGIYKLNDTETNYGTGKAVTELYGGKIHQVFGGSNTKGNVRGGTAVTMPQKPTDDTTSDYCAALDVKEIYGAGQNAEQDGGVTMILGCITGLDNVYGGAKDANVKGGVDLVVTSGKFKKVFGGNDTSGTIQGPITVTIEETGCDPVEIEELYLGGNNAAYSVFGYYNNGTEANPDFKPRSSLSEHTENAVGTPTSVHSDTQWYADPVLNIVSCTSIGDVFGGGFGSGAIMYGNPMVNINMVPGEYATRIDRDNDGNADNDPTAIGAIGNVYGGGSAADVIGNTTVNICTEPTAIVRTNMGAEIPEADRTPVAVLPAYITGDVFGAGKGDTENVEHAKVTGNTNIVIGGGTIAKSVYGGGELSQVTGNTDITVTGGTIGTTGEGGEVYGNIYGGGKGNTTNVKAGLIQGNTNISISEIVADAAYIEAHEGTTVKVGDILSTPHILHNIYGGGAYGSVGAFAYDNAGLPNGLESTNTGKATITITGGTIGTDGHENGMVFGASRGDVGAPGSIHDKVAWVYDTEVNIGTQNDETAGPQIKGSVYGSGENGHTLNDASVTIHSGMMGITETMSTDPEGQGGAKYPYRGNVYGGGCGTDTYKDNQNNEKFNPKAGFVGGNTTVLIDGGRVVRDVYGAGSMGSVVGSSSVTIDGGAEIGADGSGGGYVFAGARGNETLSDADQAYVGSSSLTISDGTIWESVFGGGQNGIVKGAVTVNLTGGEVKGDVYGGGQLAKTNTEYDATEHSAYTTTVTLGNATSGTEATKGTAIRGNLYGGGLGRQAGGGNNAVAANVNGPVTVTVTKGLATNVFGCNNLYGAPQSTVTVNIDGTNAPTANRPLPIYNVYGGGNQADYTYTDLTNPQNLQVNITGGTMDNVFGGGLSADVAGGIDVKVSGGTVVNDVYGGGALANTNTGNWSSANNTWSDTSTGTYYAEVKHLKTDTPASGDTPASQGDDVSSYYKRTGGSGTSEDPYTYQSASGTAQQNVTYYKKLDNVLNVAANGTTYKTTVSLTGGTIGNAYGGGLGQLHKDASGTQNTEGYQPETPAVAAMVYGDVEITVGNGTGTAAFTADVEYISGGSENVAKHGRVFGCNNLNGTPKGKVTVTINSTKRTDGSSNHVKGEFEIQGVYGGGNLSNYEPSWFDDATEFGQHTKVIVDGCSNTSINKVYGGGNAADVPFTDVEINGAFEIGYVFGGGNGGDKINKGAGWEANPGASVTHYANVMLRGGTIGQAFGGSDTKGTVGGADIKQETSADCPLRIVNLYGAGNGEEANSDGDINIEISACGEGSEIQNVFGGSYKANIKGSVTLTIKSGIFTSVYGGNDRLGSIGGNITVNIEETDNCSKPIIIQNLYGGCYQTAYPGEGAKTYLGSPYPKDQESSYTPFTSGKITVNVKSATRIDRIYGGSENGAVTGDTEVNINMVRGSQSGQHDVALPSYYGETGAVIPGNIKNVTTGGYVEVHGLVTDADVANDPSKTQSSVVGYYTWSGSDYTPATGYALANTTYYKQSVKGDIEPGIGSIGEVFGGGNRGNVSGNATVNIVTEPTVTMISGTDNPETTDVDERVHTVLGAHITGNVYGGGNLADVKGNTAVNICTKYSDTNSRYEALAEGTEKVTIGGNIYGGGKGADDNFFCDKGMVGVVDTNDGNQGDQDLGTHIHIGNGKIGTIENGALKAGTGNIYGGGEVGRVEFHSVVEVGLTPQTNSVTSAPEILGNVFGGGKGVETHGYAALLRGHTSVTVQQNAKVRNSVYGGGEISTIGRFWIKNVNNNVSGAPTAPTDLPDGMPYALKDGGDCTVSILDNAEIGPTTIMAMPQFIGNVFGAGKGFLPKVYDYSADDDDHRPKRVSPSGDDYFKNEAAYMVFIETQALVDETYVTIGGNAFVKGSVYGGSENGRVLNDTHVNITGGQIGWGKNATGTNGRHADGVWETNFVPLASTDLECPSWNYELPFAPYDKFAQTNGKYDYTGEYSAIKEEDRRENTDGGMSTGSDGHTFYGNVFGGGSGKDPFAPGKWHRQAGFVGRNTYVTITGGHILSNVYGGNEHTDVGTYGTDGLTHVSGGECTIQMSGGTIGVPRTPEKIAAHPESGYLFGAGKGDQRIFFNTWTNVQNTNVEVSGTAVIFGSLLGGGEDGHVLTDTKVEIKGGTIGTTGTSSFDGNVFGGGRGLSGEALTAGSVGGNVDLDITGGTIKGNVYGGGRLASVGIDFTPADDPSYGQLVDDKPAESKTYGHISIDISGGTIGTTTASDDTHPVGGNVYGGSMGRITLLNGSLNPLWPKQAVVKLTNVTISGGEIKNNVYGGSEYGVVRNQATVNMTGGNVYGNVFGGGYGSDKQDQTTITAGGYTSENPTLYYTFTPMLWTGCVSGNTFVNISGGTVAKNVYGGGDMASVGLVNFNSSKDGETYKFNYITKHDDSANGFALSWPYQFEYIKAAPNDDAAIGGNAINGKATVSITGGTIGTKTNGDYADNTGFVFGGSKGKVWFGATKETVLDITTQRYTEAFMANVLKTEVTIDGGTMRTVYGGGEDGHVYEDTKVTINDGTIENSVFGGGKGEGIFKTTLWQQDSTNPDDMTAHEDLQNQNVHSWTAGKVYGNTEVIMNGGSVGMFIYGGGNLGSVGKGNYAGGSDDYSTAGYGELPNNSVNSGKLWTTSSSAESTTKDDAYYFLNSGISTVTILGGTVGPTTGTGIDGDGIPYGSVFGGSRGKAAKDVGVRSPRYRYVPDFFLGYVNKAVVNIGGTSAALSSNSPTIYGSVYGGGQDGHVRNSTEVRIFNGTIQGQPDAAKRSGHVFGAGSGIGKYDTGTLLNSEPLMACSNSSGSVTCTTLVEVYENATIKGNVYGGGAMASVGPPQTGQGFDEYNTTTNYTTGNRAHGSKSFTQVDIKGGTVEGDVFGASRGPSDTFKKEQFDDKGITYDPTKFATDLWSDVNISGGNISGSVYGGGETGYVKCGVTVDVTGGTISQDVYGGGARANTNTSNWKNNAWADATLTSAKYTTAVNLQGGTISGDVYGGGLGRKAATDVTEVDATVYGDITVNLNKDIEQTAKGCILNRIFGCNNLQGSPQGNVTVHVYATQNAEEETIKIKKNNSIAGLRIYASKKAELEFWLNRASENSVTDGDITAAQVVYNAPGSTDDDYKAQITILEGKLYKQALNYWITQATTAGVNTETAQGVYNNPSATKDDVNTQINNLKSALREGSYDVRAVYGGGNLAPYEPVNAFLTEDTEAKDRARTTVLIDGCDLTSIQKVYGGGNAASVPATYIIVTGTYEIEELFGGGNGKDQYSLDGTTLIDNPGAHVGYKNYSTLNGTTWTENEDADTKEKRATATQYHYGSGITTTNITGGVIHNVYGGSDTKGNIRTSARSTIEDAGVCEMHIDNATGGGKDSPMDAGVDQNLDCVKNVTNIYGGSENATIENDIVVNITNGTIEKVFGGNNKKGMIKGSITINIEEKGCQPIIIGELYGGGYQAPYSVYGYATSGTGAVADDTYIITPLNKNDDGALATPYKNPRINIISATRIDAVYGGGYQAKMIGCPRINVNMQEGQVLAEYVEDDFVGDHTKDGVAYKGLRIDETTHNGILSIGTIGNIYGGGYEADVVGDTYVEIGTGEWINANGQREMDGTIKVDNEDLTTTFTYNATSEKWTYEKTTGETTETIEITGTPTPTRNAATITDNVYGGGKGKADTFECEKAMVGKVNSGEGSTNVLVGNGTIGGNVYGGGMVGRVEANTTVTIGLEGNETNEPIIEGDVFGAGQGVATHGYSGLIRGHSTVTVQGKSKVRGSVYGGGQKATVGRFYVKNVNDADYEHRNDDKYKNVPTGMPYALISGGKCAVTIQDDAEIGPDDMVMTADGGPDDHGHVFGAGMGITPYVDTDTENGEPGRWYAPNNVYTWQSYAGDENETKYLEYIQTLALGNETDVTIKGNAFVKGSVYGGSENGRVLNDTHVTIDGDCQIGSGYVQMADNGTYLTSPYSLNRRYTNEEWTAGHLIKDDESNYSTSLPECASWRYELPYSVHDKFAGTGGYDPKGGAVTATDGHTFYGNVFGGGSGYYPYAAGKWHRAAGTVGGNTVVDILGGHILSSVFGGNEMTDVGTYQDGGLTPISGGKCTINMVGGTVGVPRTLEQIKAHPVTCYVFGAGKGDQRIYFNTWTNVREAEVNISGNARIYGSTFGGGEDGHVIEDAKTNIGGSITIGTKNYTHPTETSTTNPGVIIGTTGTSYVDGNVFGGGRGYSGDAQTAGTVGGNVTVNISNGKMLGSVYGGGRLASVGTQFTAPNDDNYGNFLEDETTGENPKTYGHVTINISGGTIGNDEEKTLIATKDHWYDHTKGGNVFGGSMGRLELLNGTRNPIWPKMAQVKTTDVTISGTAVINSNVYGGGELGTVRDNAKVTISGGTVRRDVYGGGYGSPDRDYTIFSVNELPNEDDETYESAPNTLVPHTYAFTPMQFAGCVGKSATVDVTGGYIRKSVYGGGEMASVGVINFQVAKKTSADSDDFVVKEEDDGSYVYKNFHKHDDASNGFALSWPYHFEFVPTYDGATHINITGGRIGTTEADDYGTDNGDVYGAGKGIAGDYKDYVFCANVGSTDVKIDYTNDNNKTLEPEAYMDDGDCIAGAVYGGGENGHVMGDTHITLTEGLIGHAMYGGGSGKGRFTTSITRLDNGQDKEVSIYSITAGKVFGNTNILMTGGYVVRNVFGGGTMGSVGKGNYAGGADDYSTAGYGEKLSGNLWDGNNPFSQAFLSSGICTVKITGGTVGYTGVKDGLPYGNVFGGCRGAAAPNITESPRYLYSPEFFVGYANETNVTIGKTRADFETEDKYTNYLSSEHVGETGYAPLILGSVYGGGQDGHVRRDATVTINSGTIGKAFDGTIDDLDDDEWLHRGNVYGAGSGIGKYQYDFNYDDKIDDTVEGITYHGNSIKEEDYSTSAGSVTRFTTVNINGGTIHRNVYGGGSMASVGAPKIGQDYLPFKRNDDDTTTKGKQSQCTVNIAGTIGTQDEYQAHYGGEVYGASRGLSAESPFGSVVWTLVNVKDGANIQGNVFGGGDAGMVKKDAEVIIGDPKE